MFQSLDAPTPTADAPTTSSGVGTVAYIPDTSPHPHPWDDDALPVIGALLHDLHDATTDFRPPPGAAWTPRYLPDLHDHDIAERHHLPAGSARRD
ncbi:MAG: hypothetical protein ACYDEN_03815 [Acidimicrobiales bacterium]